MFTTTGILIALIALTIALAARVSRPFLGHGGSHGQDSCLCRPVRSSGSVHRRRLVRSRAAFPTDEFLHRMPQHGDPRKKLVHSRRELYPCATLSESPRAAGQSLLYLPHRLCFLWLFEGQDQGPKVHLYAICEYAAQSNSYKRRIQQPAVPALPCQTPAIYRQSHSQRDYGFAQDGSDIVSYLPRYDSQRLRSGSPENVGSGQCAVYASVLVVFIDSRPSRRPPRQPDRQKQKRQVRLAAQLPLKGKAFSILTAALDVTERAEVEALARR